MNTTTPPASCSSAFTTPAARRWRPAIARELGGDRVEVFSAGSEPADSLNPVAVAAMAEEGIDIAGNEPAILTTDAVRAADVVITMGCGDTCPIFPGKRYEDWELTDPAGLGIDEVRPIRDEIQGAGRGALLQTF